MFRREGQEEQLTKSICRLGRESRDMGLFKDDDGKGYLLTEDVRQTLYFSFF